MLRLLIPLLLLIPQFATAQSRTDRYALILEEPSVVRQAAKSGGGPEARAASESVGQIRAAQDQLIRTLEEQEVTVTGSTQHLINAVFVMADRKKADELRALPGVRRAVRMGLYKPSMNRAIDLVRAPQAWSLVGGMANAGEGVKIGFIDTGIDHEHPAFQDLSLQMPPGYPACAGSACDYTNNKVIAARSYVDLLVLPDVPEISRPDDLSPRDRVGHGTAVAMVAAGASSTGSVATISGVAPKAYVGNYKVFGSPGVNDVTFGDVIIQALTDAALDGMDIVVLALEDTGGAEWGPNDRGATCDLEGNQPCDVVAAAAEAAASQMAVVVAAGNDGDLTFAGSRFPAENSINSPGTAPSAITVGATTNAHTLYHSVKVTGGGVPSGLDMIPALFGDGPVPAGPLTAPLRDVGATEPNSTACDPVGLGTLTGAIALVDRGGCSFATKIINVQQAGAAGAILRNDSDFLFPITGVMDTAIPAVLIGSTDGQSLRDFIGQNQDRPVTLDPALTETDAFADDIAFFSSRGPSIRTHDIKPELVAPGTDLYVATQNYDPNGDMWDPAGFTVTQGTSFAVPAVAGALAMSLQISPDLSPQELKSTVVNTAVPKDQLFDFDENGVQVPTSVKAAGAGRLNAEDAVDTTVTVSPATLSFGVIDGNLPNRPLRFTNLSSEAVTLNLTVEPNDPRLTLSANSVTVQPGQVGEVSVGVNQVPAPGAHEGYIVATGGSVPVRVPFLYLRSDGIPYNVVPIAGFDFVGNVDEFVDLRDFNLLFKVVDRYGIPQADVPVLFRTTLGGGFIDFATETTDDLGIAAATAVLGGNPGEQEFTGEVEGRDDLLAIFAGRAKLRPRISAVVDGASRQTGGGLAPGSYIEIYGSALSEGTRVFNTPYLPLAIAGVSVSFDLPGRAVSYPGRLTFVSEGQVNVQIPWELEGENLVLMKVSTGILTESPLFQIPLARHLPAFFEITDLGGTGRLVAAALDGNYQVISSANPVRRGQVVQFFMNGLGPVDNRPPTGEPSPASPLANTLETPEVTIGGWTSSVIFSGLSPGSVGLYQVNVIVPEGLAPGLYEVVLSIGGVSSEPALLYIGE